MEGNGGPVLFVELGRAGGDEDEHDVGVVFDE